MFGGPFVFVMQVFPKYITIKNCVLFKYLENDWERKSKVFARTFTINGSRITAIF